jgi:putative hydrolase of the HAD superfamily
VPRLIQIYREHEPAIKPFPEVPGLLSDLKTHYLLGLLSDGYLDVQRRKLKALKLAEWFDAIVYSDEWGSEAWKPSTRPFEALLHRLGHVLPEEAIYVADNPAKDFLAARKSGLLSVEVRRFHGVYSRVDPPTPEHRPNFVIPSLNGLPAALLQLQTDS